MAINAQEFRAVLGRFTTGVTVVTTIEGTHRLGITVNAFSSVSLDPPLVLVCVERTAYIHDILRRTGIYAVNILGAEQRDTASCFAGRSQRRDAAFCDVPSHHVVTGAPVLDGALAFVDCRIVDIYPGGDHSIFVGQVEALGESDGTPLLYFRGKYTHLDRELP